MDLHESLYFILNINLIAIFWITNTFYIEVYLPQNIIPYFIIDSKLAKYNILIFWAARFRYLEMIRIP